MHHKPWSNHRRERPHRVWLRCYKRYSQQCRRSRESSQSRRPEGTEQVRDSLSKALAIIPIYGEASSIGTVLERFEPGFVDEICLVADSPLPTTLNMVDEARQEINVPIHLVHNSERKGIGYAIRQGYRYALDNNFDLIVVMAG